MVYVCLVLIAGEPSCNIGGIGGREESGELLMGVPGLHKKI